MHLFDRFAQWARWGFAARGLTYFIMGWFAVRAALGAGQPEDARNAFIEVFQVPLGRPLLIALAVGFAGHGAWRIAQALLDLERHGRDLRGMTLRAAQLAGATLALSLGLFAADLALGWQGDDPARYDGARVWTAWLLTQPLGRWLVGAIGLAVLGTAAGQLWGAWSRSFQRNLVCGPKVMPVLCIAGQIGLLANATVLALVGIFFVSAGWYMDSAESGGIMTALETLWRLPAGRWLLGAVAAGLFAFGIFSFALAIFRRIDTPKMAARLRAAARRAESRLLG